MIEPMPRHPGVFIAKGKEDALVTINTVPGEAVYREKRITVEVGSSHNLHPPLSFTYSTSLCHATSLIIYP